MAYLGNSTSALELLEEDFDRWPMFFPDCVPSIQLLRVLVNLIELLVSSGGNIYAQNSKGHTPLSLAKGNPALKADMVYRTRRALLLFFEAVSKCMTADLVKCMSFQQVANNIDLGRYIVRFL